MLILTRRWAASIALLALSACASMEILPEGTDFGAPPTGFDAEIRQRIEATLRDPESARFRISGPQRAYINHGAMNGGKVYWKGWAVDVDVNAKNGFGGYVGFQRYVFFYREGKLERMQEPKGLHPLVSRVGPYLERSP